MSQRPKSTQPRSSGSTSTTYIVEETEPRWYTSAGLWFWFFFCIIVLLLFIWLIVISVNYNNYHNDYHQFSALSTKLFGTSASASEQHTALSSSLVALASVMRTKEKLSLILCHRQIYYTQTDTESEPLLTLDSPIDAMTNETMKDYYYYPLSVKLAMEFNIDTQDYRSSPKMRIRNNRPYMTLAYNITTKYDHFSTIKLEELEFAVDDRSILPVRSFTLCSNNPLLNIRRCDALISRHNKLLLSDVLVAPLLTAPATPKPSARQTVEDETPSGRRTMAPTGAPTRIIIDNEAGADADDDYYTSDFSLINNNDRARDNSQAEEIAGIRVYNFVFYREEKRPSSTKRSADETGTTRIKAFKEAPLLTVEPNKC